MLSKKMIRDVLETIRAGEDPQNLIPNNFIQTYGKKNFEATLLEVIEDIWLPIGDKAFFRMGYQAAVETLTKYVCPEDFPSNSKKDDAEYDDYDMFF